MANKLLAVLYDRPLPARNLRQLLGDISPATLSRLTKLVGAKIVSFGQARASTYARPRDLPGIGHQLPVYRIDENGNALFSGTLWSLYGGYWWAGEGWSSRYYSSIPWFIYDLKPDGFVGRAFALRFGSELGLSERLNSWKEDDVLVALTRRGEDTVGDVIVGEESLSRYMVASRLQPVICSVTDYPRLAEEAIAGDPAGSSAGGEQPKFTVLTEREDLPIRVLVKFSPLLSTPSGQRWSDLLVCEHIALKIVGDMGISAVATSIHQVGNRTFLEVDRFDRIGIFGRTPVNSLTVVDSEFIGMGSNWTAASKKLLSAKILSPDDATNLSRLDLFGSLIANTDRHHGNISLIPANQERTKFKLSPAYDMLPMYYRPRDGEELSAGTYHPPLTFELGDVYENARRFWLEAGKDLRISEPFRILCDENHDILQKIASGPRIIGPHG
ncbi:MAG: type II toxin-antitoxin system HipA family toxin YjjJ [Steroidobacteraceae bacterium]|nr:type II toxin-antitoxin system HipA family toxin YjjJ [Deltaproteobacteria bacterium]